MAAAPIVPPSEDRLGLPELPSEAYLASQRWTAERVRLELVDERRATPRYEFIDGQLLVSPSPAYAHQVALRELYDLLAPYVRTHGLGEVAWSPIDVEVAPGTIAQPDLFVLPSDEARRVRRPGYRPIYALTLAIEVLSPSTQRNDRVIKREFYRRAGVSQYWVVDPGARVIEVSEPGPTMHVRLHDHLLAWHPAGAPEPLVIDVAAYFARVLGGDADPVAAVIADAR